VSQYEGFIQDTALLIARTDFFSQQIILRKGTTVSIFSSSQLNSQMHVEAKMHADTTIYPFVSEVLVERIRHKGFSQKIVSVAKI